MVIHAFPAAKLGALLVKQISKPIATYVKTQAKNHPVFRRYVCLPPAHFYNWCERKAKMWLLNMGQPVNITVLNEAASIELGANLLGEAVIFIIAAGILVSEYNRSSRKEAAKEAARQAEMESLQNTIKELFIQTEEQGAHIREISRKLSELDPRGSPPGSSSYQKPQSKPRDPPPQNSSSSSLTAPSINITNAIKSQQTYQPLKGVVFRAINDVENQFFVEPPGAREPGIVSVALNLLYRDVYRINLTF